MSRPLSRPRVQILREAAQRLNAKLERQQRRRLVSPRQPWGQWPKPGPSQEEARASQEEERKAALMDEALTLHTGALYLMAPNLEG